MTDIIIEAQGPLLRPSAATLAANQGRYQNLDSEATVGNVLDYSDRLSCVFGSAHEKRGGASPSVDAKRSEAATDSVRCFSVYTPDITGIRGVGTSRPPIIPTGEVAPIMTRGGDMEDPMSKSVGTSAYAERMASHGISLAYSLLHAQCHFPSIGHPLFPSPSPKHLIDPTLVLGGDVRSR